VGTLSPQLGSLVPPGLEQEGTNSSSGFGPAEQSMN
jgi:hypothetical protein